jgi:hypothetical protein
MCGVRGQPSLSRGTVIAFVTADSGDSGQECSRFIQPLQSNEIIRSSAQTMLVGQVCWSDAYVPRGAVPWSRPRNVAAVLCELAKLLPIHRPIRGLSR